METNTIIGYRVQDVVTGRFINHDGNGYHWVSTLGAVEPEPISQPDAYRRLAAYITAYPDAPVPTVVPVYRELTPMERTSRELGNMLTSLCNRHGLDLGLSREQIERQIAKELAELGANRR
jgi:uncharacterized protein YjiS (DUF1127 family)